MTKMFKPSLGHFLQKVLIQKIDSSIVPFVVGLGAYVEFKIYGV